MPHPCGLVEDLLCLFPGLWAAFVLFQLLSGGLISDPWRVNECVFALDTFQYLYRFFGKI